MYYDFIQESKWIYSEVVIKLILIDFFKKSLGISEVQEEKKWWPTVEGYAVSSYIFQVSSQH